MFVKLSHDFKYFYENLFRSQLHVLILICSILFYSIVFKHVKFSSKLFVLVPPQLYILKMDSKTECSYLHHQHGNSVYQTYTEEKYRIDALSIHLGKYGVLVQGWISNYCWCGVKLNLNIVMVL